MVGEGRKDDADQNCEAQYPRHPSNLGPMCLGGTIGVLAGWVLLTRFSVFQPSKAGWGMTLCFLVLDMFAGCVGAWFGYAVLGREDES